MASVFAALVSGPGPAPHAARRVVHIASRALDVGSLVAPRCQRGGPRPDGREITASGDVQNLDDAVFFADFHCLVS